MKISMGLKRINAELKKTECMKLYIENQLLKSIRSGSRCLSQIMAVG